MPKKLKLMWPLPLTSFSDPDLLLVRGLIGGKWNSSRRAKKLTFSNSIGIHRNLLSVSNGFRHSGVRESLHFEAIQVFCFVLF